MQSEKVGKEDQVRTSLLKQKKFFFFWLCSISAVVYLSWHASNNLICLVGSEVTLAEGRNEEGKIECNWLPRYAFPFMRKSSNWYSRNVRFLCHLKKKKKNTMLYFTYIGKSIHIEGFCRYISTHIHVCRCFRVQLVYKVYCECLSVYSFYCVQHFSYWFTILKVYLQLSTYLLGDQSHSHFYLAYKVLGWWYEWYISCHANLASKNTVQKDPNFRGFDFWRLKHEYLRNSK